ncbi:MAG: ATP-binding protein [Moraxellaceae bacterium]
MPLLMRHDASANHHNLARLCLLRTILLAGLLLALGVAEWGLGVAVFSDRAITAALLLLTMFNGWTLWRLHRGGRVSEAELFAQLLIDVVLMTIILYRTGGSTNPFVSWYLVPLTIAAATLRIGFTAVLALLTLSAYSLLLFHYVPFEPFGGMQLSSGVALMPDDPHAHHQMKLYAGADKAEGFNLHVFGMWLNFLLSAGLIAFFVSRMSHALREQDQRLSEQHERLLQREQVVAIGALAAGAAHELGTPLSTMTVIARDIEQELPADSPLREDVSMLRRQLSLCRDILHDLRDQAASEGRVSTLYRLVQAAVERMEVVYPARQFSLLLQLEDLPIMVPSTLPQVLVNLLDNAAQAARQLVTIKVHGTDTWCLVDICDDGKGIEPDVARRLGQPFVSDKANGMGIGYFLSNASINPLGGRIEVTLRPEGGTCTRLCLPWTAFVTSAGVAK